MAQLILSNEELEKIISAFTTVVGFKVNDGKLSISNESGVQFSLDDLNLSGNLKSGDVEFKVALNSVDGKMCIDLN